MILVKLLAVGDLAYSPGPFCSYVVEIISNTAKNICSESVRFGCQSSEQAGVPISLLSASIDQNALQWTAQPQQV